MMMKIFLVDHHILFREGLAGLLAGEPGIEIIGAAGSARDVLEILRERKPDILLLDIALTDGQGLALLRAASARLPELKTVVLSMEIDDDQLLAVFENGAKGFLSKEIPVNHLVEALRAVLRGEFALSRAMTARLLDQLARRSLQRQHVTGLDQLTERELDVLEQISAGASNREIAASLRISENTVKAHVRRILEKLNLPNRREARRLALDQGAVARLRR